jgi:hypothetical protein
MPPKTPPIIGPTVSGGFDDIPLEAGCSPELVECDATAAPAVEVCDAFGRWVAGSWVEDADGDGLTSLCAIANEVLDDSVGVVPLEAGLAEVDAMLGSVEVV